jgi:hypothetical protein
MMKTGKEKQLRVLLGPNFIAAQGLRVFVL